MSVVNVVHRLTMLIGTMVLICVTETVEQYQETNTKVPKTPNNRMTIDQMCRTLQPETLEKRCPLCYQHEQGRCLVYKTECKPGFRCGFFIAADDDIVRESCL